MKPEYKAFELVNQFKIFVNGIIPYEGFNVDGNRFIFDERTLMMNAKGAAMQAVDEIMRTGLLKDHDAGELQPYHKEYWFEVKKYIRRQ